MQDAMSSLASASQLVESGHIKEAYFAYIDTAQQSLKSLSDIKFVHSSIVSAPKQYAGLISAMRTCLTHIENIIETHSPSSRIVSLQPPSDSPVVHHTAKYPPPLPPKPNRIQKPSVPPKPTRTVLSRPTSPSNDHEDNLVVPPVPRPHTMTDDLDRRPISAPPPAMALKPPARPRPELPYCAPEEYDSILGSKIVSACQVDPNHLIPAQTNAGDSLSPPSNTTLNTDHVPLIPAPPLLTTHRLLQEKLDELEANLKSCRARKQRLLQEDRHDLDDSEDQVNQLIIQYTELIAQVKQTLNRVRTTYMSAGTIPTVLHFPPYLIAYQVTLIESAIFKAIPPQALLQHSAKHPHPRIVASTDFFNYITRIIEHGILLPQEASSRAQHINHWIKVASKCLDLNNFQTLKAVVSALGTPPVQRLRRTWAYIPKKSLTKLESLLELMSEADNYARYREHMGMVNTSLVNGKSTVAIRKEFYDGPTVPFLGTFIHDMTYLVAAAKPHPPMEDLRVRELLHTIELFQQGQPYPPVPPSSFLKSSQKHHIRPALSSAFHKSASGIGRLSGNMFGLSNDDESVKEAAVDDDDIAEQQQTITQYILMRSWVSQNTVDELSMLREPPRQPKNNVYSGHRSTSGSNYNTSSIMSNTSSMMRFSTGSVSLSPASSVAGGNESRPTSMDEYASLDDPEKGGSFWPFRKSSDSQRSSGHDKRSNPDIITTREESLEHTAPPQTVPPHIPPRPPPRKDNDADFKNTLSQHIQQSHISARQA